MTDSLADSRKKAGDTLIDFFEGGGERKLPYDSQSLEEYNIKGTSQSFFFSSCIGTDNEFRKHFIALLYINNMRIPQMCNFS